MVSLGPLGSTIGFEVRAVGFNPEAARYSGMQAGKDCLLWYRIPVSGVLGALVLVVVLARGGSVALRVEGPLDATVLSLSLSEIVRRHEALRTVFAAVDGEPVQVVQRLAPRLEPGHHRRLVGEGLEFHIPKCYIYFAMAFSVGVEMLNMMIRGKSTPVKLQSRMDEE